MSISTLTRKNSLRVTEVTGSLESDMSIEMELGRKGSSTPIVATFVVDDIVESEYWSDISFHVLDRKIEPFVDLSRNMMDQILDAIEEALVEHVQHLDQRVENLPLSA